MSNPTIDEVKELPVEPEGGVGEVPAALAEAINKQIATEDVTEATSMKHMIDFVVMTSEFTLLNEIDKMCFGITTTAQQKSLDFLLKLHKDTLMLEINSMFLPIIVSLSIDALPNFAINQMSPASVAKMEEAYVKNLPFYGTSSLGAVHYMRSITKHTTPIGGPIRRLLMACNPLKEDFNNYRKGLLTPEEATSIEVFLSKAFLHITL